MPAIRLSADLRNSYNDISSFCHQYGESVLRGIVGHQDKAEMKKYTRVDIETYDSTAW